MVKVFLFQSNPWLISLSIAPYLPAKRKKKAEMVKDHSVRTLRQAQGKPKRLPLATCPFCHKKFQPKRSNQIFDFPNCRKRAWDKKHLKDLVFELMEETLKRRKENENSD
jgi:hypothetical protein